MGLVGVLIVLSGQFSNSLAFGLRQQINDEPY